VVGPSTEEARKAAVPGNCGGGRLGIMLGWTACCCPVLVVFLSYPFTLPLWLYPLIALFEHGME